MLPFNNDHIFTGYIKQLLADFNLPTCKIYSTADANYFKQNNQESKRIVETPSEILKQLDGNTYHYYSTNYLRNNQLYTYLWDPKTDYKQWKENKKISFELNKVIPGLTKKLVSHSTVYDTYTHEYLGDFLRFLRDYYNVNLMPLYNCFNNKIYQNVSIDLPKIENFSSYYPSIQVDPKNSNYKIYAFPVKLFEKYTIAIDSNHGIELFCGLYNTLIDKTNESVDLIRKTYQKINKTQFNQPFLFDKLSTEYWNFENDLATLTEESKTVGPFSITRWDILNRERDLKLFIKVPISCKSSIVVLEGDYCAYNDSLYTNVNSKLEYNANKTVLNFSALNKFNNFEFKPIGKLQLLAFNDGQSYPFSDRLIEYLLGSAITPLDEIKDNIKRVQKVMNDNGYYFKIPGIWESSMQQIGYDYLVNNGPFESKDGKINNKRQGRHPKMGYRSRNQILDALGYFDRDLENIYANLEINEKGLLAVKNTAHSVDIYNGLWKDERI